MSDQGESNQIPEHVHAYEVKGTQVHWAECACSRKLTGENGLIVGSVAKINAAIERLRAAIDDPVRCLMTDHDHHPFPIPVGPDTLAALLDVAEHVADFVAAADLRVGQLIGHDDHYFDSYHDARYPLVTALDEFLAPKAS